VGRPARREANFTVSPGHRGFASLLCRVLLLYLSDGAGQARYEFLARKSPPPPPPHPPPPPPPPNRRHRCPPRHVRDSNSFETASARCAAHHQVVTGVGVPPAADGAYWSCCATSRSARRPVFPRRLLAQSRGAGCTRSSTRHVQARRARRPPATAPKPRTERAPIPSIARTSPSSRGRAQRSTGPLDAGWPYPLPRRHPCPPRRQPPSPPDRAARTAVAEVWPCDGRANVRGL